MKPYAYLALFSAVGTVSLFGCKSASTSGQASSDANSAVQSTEDASKTTADKTADAVSSGANKTEDAANSTAKKVDDQMK